MDTASNLPSLIPPFRNYVCKFYGFCLDAHAFRDRGEEGWDCDGCDFVTSRQEIDPTEGERAAQRLAEVYKVRRENFRRPRPMLLEKSGGCWRQAEEVAT